MNLSTKEIGQPEQVTNNEQDADNQQVSPSSTNAVLSEVFSLWEERSEMLRKSLVGVHPSTSFWAKITSQKFALDKCIEDLKKAVANNDNICPDCGNYGILHDEHGRNSTCPCHF